MMQVRLRTEYVRRHLVRGNWTQSDFAQALEISDCYCSQLLSGKRSPSPQLRRKLQEVLCADFDTLFEIQEDPL